MNAQHIKAVPGRKTDVKDAEWIANLLWHGLLKGSFIPNREQRELRELVRYRRSLIDERSKELSELARKCLKNKKADLERALRGQIGPHQKLMLEAQLKHIDFLDDQIDRLNEEVKARMLPFEKDLDRLDTIPDVGRRNAEQILAEIGTDVKNQSPFHRFICVRGQGWLQVTMRAPENENPDEHEKGTRSCVMR